MSHPNKVIEYTNMQGSRIIAARATDGMWHVLCVAALGHIHSFKWTYARLMVDAEGAEVKKRYL